MPPARRQQKSEQRREKKGPCLEVSGHQAHSKDELVHSAQLQRRVCEPLCASTGHKEAEAGNQFQSLQVHYRQGRTLPLSQTRLKSCAGGGHRAH